MEYILKVRGYQIPNILMMDYRQSIKVFLNVTIISLIILIIFQNKIISQTPFPCNNKMIAYFQESNSLGLMDRFNPITINFNKIELFFPQKDLFFIFIAYHPPSNYIHGLANNGVLYQIDYTGNISAIKGLNLDPNLRYIDASYNRTASHLAINYTNEQGTSGLIMFDVKNNKLLNQITEASKYSLSGLVFDAYDNDILYSFDRLISSLLTINIGSNRINEQRMSFSVPTSIEFLHVTPSNELFAYGPATISSIDAYLVLDENDNVFKSSVTGAKHNISSVTHCPYGLYVSMELNPKTTLECSDVSINLDIFNNTKEEIPSAKLQFVASSLENIEVLNIPEINYSLATGIFEIRDVLLKNTKTQLKLKGRLSEGFIGTLQYQTSLLNVPEHLGTMVPSDNIFTVKTDDFSRLKVQPFYSDTVYEDIFLCDEESFILDVSDLGTNIQWNTGSTNSSIQVSKAGVFNATANTHCGEATKSFNVVQAKCPFEVSITKEVLDDKIFACSNFQIMIIVENNSGNILNNVQLLDSMPEGIFFQEIEYASFKTYNLVSDLPSQTLKISKISMSLGLDTVIVNLSAGRIKPGNYFSQSKLINLPSQIGHIRFSDDPHTDEFNDSTAVIIKGINDEDLINDTFRINKNICHNSSIRLDLSEYGQEFIWYDGSNMSYKYIEAAGKYFAKVLDGCTEIYILFIIESGNDISIELDELNQEINLGEQVQMDLLVNNEGISSTIEWIIDPEPDSFNVNLNGYSASFIPLSDSRVLIKADNTICFDSLAVNISVNVDYSINYSNVLNTRLHDNNYHLLAFPGKVYIDNYQLFDRWGSLMYSISEITCDQYCKIYSSVNLDQGQYSFIVKVRYLNGDILYHKGTLSIF